MSKFQYAPGLPGYGTQGVDGSNGLLGMAIYFSYLDGETQYPTLRNRIINNEYLNSTGGNIPGYPERVYQDGDIFVDINGKVYEIDSTLPNNFKSTGERLNTSTIFSEGVDTSTDTIFTRYHNSYNTSKFLLDNVFSIEGVANYTQSPDEVDGIYGIPAVNFAQIKYVDVSLNGYLPYTIWNNTVNTTSPESAIALVKSYSNDHWRWGNISNSSEIRDVSLSLDFSDVIMSNNLLVSNYISPVSDVLSIITLNSNSLIGGSAAYIDISTGKGGEAIGSAAGDGGSLNISLGGGGDVTSGTGAGGIGGYVKIKAGDSGISKSNSATTLYGEKGGEISIFGGIGGEADNNVGGSFENGGDGGDVSILGGSGNSNSSSNRGGDGGSLYLEGGTGGDGLADGVGGSMHINGGLNYTGTNQSRVYLQDNEGPITIGGQIYIADGSLSLPAISFSSDTNTGFYKPANDRMGLALGTLNGRQGYEFINNGEGAYISSVDCSTVIQPKSTSANLNGYGIEVVTKTDGGNSGDLVLRTSNAVSGYNAGGVLLKSGNGGSGSGVGGSITISLGTGGAAPGNLIIENLPSGSMTTHLGISGSNIIYKTNTAATSDIRLKDLSEQLDGKYILNSIKSLTAYKWKYNDYSEEIFSKVDREKIHLGVIAQDVEKVFPELIVNYTGNNGNNYFGLNYEMFAPIFVEAIKEQQTQIEDLKSIVNKQQEQINELLKLNNI